MIIYDDLRLVPLFSSFFEASGVHHSNQYRSIPAVLLFKTQARKHLSYDLLFKDPKCEPDDDLIVVFDTHTSERYLNWICKLYPEKQIILWFWNPAERAEKFTKLNTRVEKWSYSERDAHKWGMKCNTQFFFDCLAQEAAEHRKAPQAEIQKALFIGREKGRASQLEYLKDELEKAGIVSDFRVIPLPKKKPRSLMEKLIPYQRVIDAVKDSQILVDVYADPTAGLSLRAMEAMFFGKKIITNRPLMREEDFYDSHNIYILNEEKRSLKEFLSEAYIPTDPAVRDRYLLSNWLKRFKTEEQENDKQRQS